MTLNSSSAFATQIKAYRHRGSTKRLYKATQKRVLEREEVAVYSRLAHQLRPTKLKQKHKQAGPLEKWMTLNSSSVFATKIKACRHRGAALSPSRNTQPQKAKHN